MGKILTNNTAAWLAGQIGAGRTAPPPRRAQGPRDLGDATAPAPQWTLELAVADGGATALRVHRGILHYGGPHWAVWPVGGHATADAYQDIPLDIADGTDRLVLWHTSAAPCPLYHCPLQPAGPEIDFQLAGDDCSCTLSGYPRPGSPEDYSPGPGEVSLHAADAIESDGADWTACVPLGIVSRAGDRYTVTQLHDCTITVRAIVRGDTPPCGHPGNEPGAGGDTDHPGDYPGDDHPGDSPSPPSSGECD